MTTKQLGSTDLELSRIGLGTWAMGGGGWRFGWGPQDDEESIRTIYRALDLGINWIDTAPVYGLGHAEEVIGNTIKGMGEKPIIATKCSRVWNDQGEISSNLKRDSVRRELENSLRRLQRDAIDLYQLHWPIPEEDIEEGWSTVAEFLQEGKIRYAGVSNFNIAQLDRIRGIQPVASLQPPYSMVVPDVEKEILAYCGVNRIGVICYSPMYKGLLTGKITKERVESFPNDDHRRNDPHFREPELSINLEFVDKLHKIAAEEEKSVAQLAVAWALRRQEVTAAIVGGRRPAQIEEIARVRDWGLSEETIARVDNLLLRRVQRVGLV
jgi:aryl-alcohol dehydrogenase-like predicted oxidoreductase